MTGVWRCRVCEGINQGGRMCATCGAVVPAGEPVRAAVRTRLPSTTPPATAPVPPTPRRAELRRYPSMADLLAADPEDLFEPGARVRITPVPGGCLMGPTPVGRRRRGWY
jgi:hypothetical protein